MQQHLRERQKRDGDHQIQQNLGYWPYPGQSMWDIDNRDRRCGLMTE